MIACTDPRAGHAAAVRHCGGWLVSLATCLALGACASLPGRDSPVVDAEVAEVATAPSDEAVARFDDALRLMRGRRHDEALQAFTALTSDWPELAGPWLNLGILEARAGHFDTAAAALRAALARDAGLLTAYNWLGEVERERGQPQAAERAYLDALALDPDYAAAHLNLGLLCEQQLGEPRRAIAHYRRYFELSEGRELRVLPWIAELEQTLTPDAEVPTP